MSEIIYFSAKQLASLIQQKKLSSVELLKAHLQQIEKINPSINAIMQVDQERILQEASNADNDLAMGKSLGPLHGVPISIKDCFLTKDIITTAGSQAFASHVPSQDATSVKRLREAGAIILGKTNLPDFAMCWDTESSVNGRTLNPYDLKRSAGGSSGGEAALIAAGGSPLGLANDGGGSIRLPAHFCGIAGFKPSTGLIPTTGLIPPLEGCFATGAIGRILSVGSMARFVEDLIYCLPILMGADTQDPNVQNYPLFPRSDHIKGLRIAYYKGENSYYSDPEVSKAINDVAVLLSEAGSNINEVLLPNINDSWEIFRNLLVPDGGEGTKTLLASLGKYSLPLPLKKSLDVFSGKKLSLEQFVTTWTRWDLYRSRFACFMEDYDIVLSPVVSFPALLKEEFFTDPKYFSNENYLVAYSLLGWPSVVVRVGTTNEGLPIGVQIVAKHWHDNLALSVAHYIEQEVGGWKMPSAQIITPMKA